MARKLGWLMAAWLVVAQLIMAPSQVSAHMAIAPSHAPDQDAVLEQNASCPPSPGSRFTPTLTTSPIGRPGQQTVVTGQGFPSGARYLVSTGGAAGSQSITVGPDGTVRFTLNISPTYSIPSAVIAFSGGSVTSFNFSCTIPIALQPSGGQLTCPISAIIVGGRCIELPLANIELPSVPFGGNMSIGNRVPPAGATLADICGVHSLWNALGTTLAGYWDYEFDGTPCAENGTITSPFAHHGLTPPNLGTLTPNGPTATIADCTGSKWEILSVVPDYRVTDDAPLRVRLTDSNGQPLSGIRITRTVTGASSPTPWSGTTDSNGEVQVSYGMPDPPSSDNRPRFSFNTVNCSPNQHLDLSYDVRIVRNRTVLSQEQALVSAMWWNALRQWFIEPGSGTVDRQALQDFVSSQALSMGSALPKIAGHMIDAAATIDAFRAYLPRGGDVVYEEWRRYDAPGISHPDWQYVIRVTRGGQTVYRQLVWTTRSDLLPQP